MREICKMTVYLSNDALFYSHLSSISTQETCFYRVGDYSLSAVEFLDSDLKCIFDTLKEVILIAESSSVTYPEIWRCIISFRDVYPH
jgi:hypothetical protein